MARRRRCRRTNEEEAEQEHIKPSSIFPQSTSSTSGEKGSTWTIPTPEQALPTQREMMCLSLLIFSPPTYPIRDGPRIYSLLTRVFFSFPVQAVRRSDFPNTPFMILPRSQVGLGGSLGVNGQRNTYLPIC